MEEASESYFLLSELLIAALRLDIEETKLQEIFAPYGAVVSCKAWLKGGL